MTAACTSGCGASNETIPQLVDHSFLNARESYPSLFDQRNAYTWFRPGPDALIDVIYELPCRCWRQPGPI